MLPLLLRYTCIICLLCFMYDACGMIRCIERASCVREHEALFSVPWFRSEPHPVLKRIVFYRAGFVFHHLFFIRKQYCEKAHNLSTLLVGSCFKQRQN